MRDGLLLHLRWYIAPFCSLQPVPIFIHMGAKGDEREGKKKNKAKKKKKISNNTVIIIIKKQSIDDACSFNAIK